MQRANLDLVKRHWHWLGHKDSLCMSTDMCESVYSSNPAFGLNYIKNPDPFIGKE